MALDWVTADALALRVGDASYAVFGRRARSELVKAEGDIFSDAGFRAVIRRVAAVLSTATQGVRSRGLERVLRALDVDWRNLTEAQRETTIRRAANAIFGTADIVGPRFIRDLTDEATLITQATRDASMSRFGMGGMGAALSVVDERVVQHAATSQAHYLRTDVGVRSALYSAVARDVVARGLEDGLDRYAIADRMKPALVNTDAARSRTYYALLASTFATRSRTYATASGFAEAGIQVCEWLSVLDEVTSEICRFMNGKRIRTGAVVDRFAAVAADADPEAVKEIQPWAGVGRTDDGARILYFKQKGARVPLAEVLRSGVGARDDAGEHRAFAAGKNLDATGITPPAHGHCRSVLLPVFDDAMVQVPAQLDSPPAPQWEYPLAPGPLGPGVIPVLPEGNGPGATVGGELPRRLADRVRKPGGRVVDNETLPAPTKLPEVNGPGVKVDPALPRRIADMVRKPPNRGVDNETLPAPASTPRAKKPLQPSTKPPTVVPQSTLDQVRPVPGRAVDNETLPEPAPPLPANPYAAAKEKLGLMPTDGYWTNHGLPTFDQPFNELVPADKQKTWNKLKTVSVNPSDILLPVGKTPHGLVKDGIDLQEYSEVYKKGDPLKLAKIGGKLYAPGYMTPKVVAAVLVGKPVDAKVIDLDKKPKAKPKPKAAPAPAPKPVRPPKAAPIHVDLEKPAVEIDADTILGTQFGDAKGSNDGGFFRGKDGVERYVKFYKDPAQAYCEHLANNIYRDLGLAAPKSTVFQHNGSLTYASELFHGGKTLAQAGVTSDNAKKFLEGFVGDVLTGNWDAVGMGNDNAMLLPDGRIARIDNGGTFLMRAKAGRKNEAVLNAITEWDKFFDSSVNPTYSRLAETAGVSGPSAMKASVAAQIRRALAVRDAAGGWLEYVDTHAPDLKFTDRVAVVKMLNARSDLLEAKLAALEAPPGKHAPTNNPGLSFFGPSAVEKAVAAHVRSANAGDQVFQGVFRRVGLNNERGETIRSTVSSWTMGYKSSATQTEVYAAYKARVSGGTPVRSDVGKAVAVGMETRRERWKALLTELGYPDAEPPEHFDLSRGMRGLNFVKAVAESWKDESVSTATLPTFAAASWSSSEKKARQFASDEGVVFRWRRCPIEQTIFDQAVDDSSFVSSFRSEHEVIAGPGHDRGLDLPKADQVVKYKGKAYTYEEREELFTALRRDRVMK